MYKQPLFGEDSSPHITSMLVSAIVTLVCWIIFCVLCFVIKFKPQTPQYKEVQIVLSSTPAVPEPFEGQAESAPAAAMQEEAAMVEPVETTPVPELPKPVETPVAAAKVEAPKKTAAPAKTSTASAKPRTQSKTKETPADKKVPEFIPSGIDLTDGYDFGTKATKATWDETKFPTEQSNDTIVKEQPEKVAEKSGFSKEPAGIKTGNTVPGAKSADLKTAKEPEALYGDQYDKIRKAVIAKGSGQNGIETSLSSESDTSDSKILRMQDGTTRRVIKSAPIEFSKEAADTIDFDSMTVKITFKVLTDGNVFPGSIKIDKEIFLDSLVVEEIKNQIKTWLLAPANSEAVAVFELTIKRK